MKTGKSGRQEPKSGSFLQKMFNRAALAVALAVCAILPSSQFTTARSLTAEVPQKVNETATPREIMDANLVLAVEANDLKLMENLLYWGADPNTQEGLPLALAADAGFTEAIKLLLAYEANPNIDEGWILAFAAVKGHEDIVKILLDAGANPFLPGVQDYLDNMAPSAGSSLRARERYKKISQMILDSRHDWENNYTYRIFIKAGQPSVSPILVHG